jgi:hypothetical protein
MTAKQRVREFTGIAAPFEMWNWPDASPPP